MGTRRKYYFRWVVFLTIILSCVLASASKEQPIKSKCCDEGVKQDYEKCSDGKNISLVCDGATSNFYSDLSYYSRFKIANDNIGEYLDAPGIGIIIRAPYFCVGTRSYTSENGIAVGCVNKRTPYSELANFEMPDEDESESIYVSMLILLNIISTVALVVTTLLYGFLKEVQDTEGKCLFHLTLVMCLVHAEISYNIYFRTSGILPNMCITNWYLIMYSVLVVFDWFAVVGHHSWTQAKSEHITQDEDQRMKWYLCFAYGFPLFIVVLCNIVAHMKKLYTKFEFELECFRHQSALIMLFFVLPIYFLAGAKIYFFWHTQKLLWNSPSLKMRCEKSRLKTMKYRLAMNGKLFIITGILWSIMAVIIPILFMIETLTDIVDFFTVVLTLLISAEGIFVFLILVVFRKRVLKALSRHSLFKDKRIFPEDWKTMADSETGEDSEIAQEMKFEKENSDNESGRIY